MTLDAAITLAVLGVLVVALVRDLVAPVTAVLGAVVVLVLAGVVPVDRAFAGFSNPATITVAALLVIAQGVQDQGGVRPALGRVLGTVRADRAVLARLVTPVTAISTVVANTPVVAMLAPPLRVWAERHGRPPSRFLMPLSFAAILGGLGTTIGTSVTLLVSGLVAEAGHDEFSILEITPLGLPIAAVGAVVIVLLAPRLLPDRRSPHAQVASHERDYTFAMAVASGGPLDGRSVAGAGLRNLAGVYLVRIERHGHEIAPVAPGQTLEAGDVLTFVGNVELVRDLRGRDGLVLAEQPHVVQLDGDQQGLVEVVVGGDSPLVGRTPKEVSFRGRYGAAIVAVHRAGERVLGKIGEVRLHAGDALLLLTDQVFVERWGDRRDFLLTVPLDDEPPREDGRPILAVGVLVAVVVSAATGLVPLVQASLAGVLVLVGTRTLRVSRARDALDLDVLLLIAAAIGLGGAVETSGLATQGASAIHDLARVVGPVGALAAVLIGTLALTELVTNAAAAALMVPVALEVATLTGSDPRAFAVTVAVGASASFLSPIGYQTNTMVYGLGGYRFGDYWRLGAPLTLVVIAVTLLVAPLVWTL